jgi:hypothetical protein
MLYRISGKFADNHTFSAQVDGDSPKDALATFQGFDDVTAYGQPITQVSVIRMEGKKRIRISDEPSKPRAPRGKAAAQPAKPAVQAGKPAQNTGKR